MSTTQTTNLGLTKATPGTGEPFSTSVVNTNLDTIDSAVGELQDSVAQLSRGLFVGGTAPLLYSALCGGEGNTQYRLQVTQSGAVNLFKSTNGGASWSVQRTL